MDDTIRDVVSIKFEREVDINLSCEGNVIITLRKLYCYLIDGKENWLDKQFHTMYNRRLNDDNFKVMMFDNIRHSSDPNDCDCFVMFKPNKKYITNFYSSYCGNINDVILREHKFNISQPR